MNAQTLNPAETEQLMLAKMKQGLDKAARNGMSWFYWVAGLSLVNTVIFLAGGKISFVFGLGFTQLVDFLAVGVAKDLGAGSAVFVHGIGIFIDIAVAAFFVGAGLLGTRRKAWAVIAGMVLYVLDGLLLIWMEDWISILFHLWVLSGLWRGLRAINALRKLEAAAPAGFLGTAGAYATVPADYSNAPAATSTAPAAYPVTSSVVSEMNKPFWAASDQRQGVRWKPVLIAVAIGLVMIAVVAVAMAVP